MARARALAGVDAKSAARGAPTNARARAPMPGVARGATKRVRPAPLITDTAMPVERIVAQPVPVDTDVCQHNRVLLDRVWESSPSAVAAYRILRTRMLQRARVRQWTTIGITSAGVNDGKSLTSLNLGLSLARERNSDVVLLDLDMRSPSISRYLGVEPPREIVHYFEHQCSAPDMFYSIGVPNLFLASGTLGIDHASELLGTPQFEQLLQYSRAHTRNPIILMDLPPVLSTDDALVVAPRIDAMLLVVSEGHTNRASVTKALEVLSEVPLAGLVLNRAVETIQDDYGYDWAKR